MVLEDVACPGRNARAANDGLDPIGDRIGPAPFCDHRKGFLDHHALLLPYVTAPV